MGSWSIAVGREPPELFSSLSWRLLAKPFSDREGEGRRGEGEKHLGLNETFLFLKCLLYLKHKHISSPEPFPVQSSASKEGCRQKSTRFPERTRESFPLVYRRT